MNADPPSFIEGLPRDPALDALVAAFVRGDYARVRRDGPGIVASAASPDVRAAAAEVMARTRPDPMSAAFFGLAAALLVLLSVYWWWKAGGRS